MNCRPIMGVQRPVLSWRKLPSTIDCLAYVVFWTPKQAFGGTRARRSISLKKDGIEVYVRGKLRAYNSLLRYNQCPQGFRSPPWKERPPQEAPRYQSPRLIQATDTFVQVRLSGLSSCVVLRLDAFVFLLRRKFSRYEYLFVSQTRFPVCRASLHRRAEVWKVTRPREWRPG